MKTSWLFSLLVCFFAAHLVSAQAPVAQSNNVVVFEDTPKSIVMLATDPNSDPLTFTIVTQPTFGTLSTIFGSTIVYTPDPGYIGPDCFVFKANDGTAFSNKGTVSIDVIPVNDRPVAFDQTVEYDLNTTVSITLMGFDDDNDPLTYTVLTQPANGTLTGSGPNRIFTPNTGFNGSTSFTFKVNDGTVDSDPATVTVDFNNVVNQAPIAENQTVVVIEDQSKNISLGASDANGNGLSYSIVSQPAHGSLTGIASAYTYVPDPNYFGPDSFTFKANDGMVDSNIATVSITVSPVNDLPVSDNKTATTQEDTPVTITLSAIDIESNTLSYALVTPPAHGTLSCTNCVNPIYTPSLNYHGSDSFTYKANDGTDDSNVATVSITVSPVNDTPIANNQNVTVQEDNTRTITLTGSDVEGSVLTFTVLTQPAHGTLTGSGVNYIYTPNSNYHGPDSFTFKVNDGTIDSSIATVSITVNSVNDTPVAINQGVTVQEDNSKAIVLAGADVEGDGLTFTVVSQPTHGVLSGSGANYTYTPNANYHGGDSFTFKANDGMVDSNIATVSITVTPVNDAPVADDQAVVYTVNASTAITLTGSDADGDALTYIIVTQPAHGILSGSGNSYTYTPNANYNGLDSYTFKVNDGSVDSNNGTVSLTASLTNRAPVAVDQTVSVNVDEDVSKVIVVVATDEDGDPLTYVIVTPPAHGTITGTGPNYTYTPNLNYNGPDSFTYKANDGTIDSNVATVNIIVNAINDAPIANNQNVAVQEDASGAITLGGSDVEGDALTFTILTQPAHGILSGSGAGYTYTPNANYNGADSFTFKANDGSVDSNIATVAITVSPVNDLPVSADQTASTQEDTPVVIALSANDIDGNTLTYTIVTPPAHGTLSCTNCANPTYTPNLNYNGTDSFTYKANDGTADSNIATVSITISPVNDMPVANDQSVTVQEDIASAITLGGSDVEGDALTFTVLTQPAHGILSGSGPNYTYTPNANYNGTDSFTFKANDGTVDSNSAVVSITVSPVNDLPVSTDQTASTQEDTPVVIALSANDVDGNSLTYTILTLPAHGTLSCTNCANPTYIPDLNYNGMDSFTYKANDGTADSNIATVSITITPVNDMPFANNQNVTLLEDNTKAITLTGGDVDGDAFTFTVLTQPMHGILTGSGADYTYTPNLNYDGADSFTFKANDGSVDSNIATVSITVSPVNDLPVSADQAFTTQEETPVAIILAGSDIDTDIDNSTLTYTIVTTPAHGTLSCLNCANPTYTPNLNYNGTDSFTYKANDGTGDSNVATVSITISPVNDIPFANDQNITILEDNTKAITLTGGDVDGDLFTFTVVTQPAHGILTGSGADYTYVPNLNYNGTDGFTFKANDGSVDSNIATVTITVSPVNDLPVSADQAVSTQEETPVGIILVASDIDNSTLSYSIATPPAHGTLSCLDCANPTYTPVLNYTGTDSFTYKANDGMGDSNVGIVTITITPVNDAPVVQNKTVDVKEDETVSVCFTVTDIENNPSLFTGAVSLDGNGSLILDPATGQFCFLFTPKPDFFGKHEVEVTVCDANDPTLCAKGIITINVFPVNDLFKVNLLGVPVDTVFATTPEDTPVSACMDITDPDGDQISQGSITNVSGGGTLTGSLDGANKFCLTFTPEKDFNGKSIWEIEFCDNGNPVLCGKITIVIDVTPVNEAPVANDQTVLVVEDTPTVISLQATDVDGDVLTSTIVTQPTHGVLSGTGLNVTYAPTLNYFGPDSFTYKVNDGTDNSNTATVSIIVTPVNDVRIIEPVPVITVPEDTEVQICLVVTDVEGDAFTYTLPTNVSGGGTMMANETAGCFTFRPLKDFNGDSFWKFGVCDSADPTSCSYREVRIIVTPVNDKPIAVNDLVKARSYEKTEPINILENDTDIESDKLIVTTTPMAGPSHGTVTLSAEGFIEYQSTLGYIGADSVTYKVCDNGVPSLCDIAVVFVEVGPAPFKIYQGLSPNGDGLNDYWRIDGIENFPNNRVQIFDRYNNMIFETSKYSNEDNTWRGQTNHSLINGNASEGTYFYSLTLGDGSDPLSGYVVLKKN